MSDGCGTIGCSGCDLASPTGHGPHCVLQKNRQPEPDELPEEDKPISMVFLKVYRHIKEFYAKLDNRDEG